MGASVCVEGLEWETVNLSCKVEIIGIVWARVWCDQIKISLTACSVERAMAARSLGRPM